MSDQIQNSHVMSYSRRQELNLQERGKFPNCCEQQSFVGKSAQIINQYGSVTATKIKGRHAKTELTQTPHTSRWVRPQDYGIADMVDEEDVVRIITDPKSPYAQVQQLALARAWDDEIIGSFRGVNWTGEDGGTSVTYANDGGLSVSAVGVGITMPKLREAKRKLMAAHNDLSYEMVYMAISAYQHDELLGLTQVVSSDYNKPMFAGNGLIQSFFGINFVHSERLEKTSTERHCIMWVKSGACAASWNGIRTRVRPRSDMWDNMQIASKMTVGGARKEGPKFVVVGCIES